MKVWGQAGNELTSPGSAIRLSTNCTTGQAFSDANFAGALRVMPVFKQNL